MRVPARDAIRNFHALGERAQWSVVDEMTSSNGHEAVAGAMGGARIFTGLADISIRPKFRLGSDPSIFASGSCFAREVEWALHAAGRKVLSWTPQVGLSNGIFHRYNTFSMINDFRFAFEGGWSREMAVQTHRGWADYTSNQICASLEDLEKERLALIALHRNLASTDVLVLTLGLIEVWFDKQTERVLNFTPSEALGKQPGRYEFRVTGYQENLDAVRELVAFGREVNPDLKVIVTVSPVPLNGSFSGVDILQSNSLSKCTLRTVAQVVADENPFVDYFPSYELVTLSDPDAVWLPDRRHVRREAVAHIIGKFSAAYLTD